MIYQESYQFIIVCGRQPEGYRTDYSYDLLQIISELANAIGIDRIAMSKFVTEAEVKTFSKK